MSMAATAQMTVEATNAWYKRGCRKWYHHYIQPPLYPGQCVACPQVSERQGYTACAVLNGREANGRGSYGVSTQGGVYGFFFFFYVSVVLSSRFARGTSGVYRATVCDIPATTSVSACQHQPR